MKRALALLLCVPLLAAAAGRAPASAKLEQVESYTIDWWTVDDGGGSASGGAYALTGTIAQADADPLQPSTGGTYQVDGGFWGGAALSNDLFRDGFE